MLKENELEALYGKIPLSEFDDKRKDLEEYKKNSLSEEETLREDYSIGTEEDFEFYVVYKAHCQTCHFHKEFTHKEIVK